MAVTGMVRQLAAGSPVPVFIVQGVDAGPAGDAERLHLEPELRIVGSPRHATVLLVAGRLPPALVLPALLVHDALPHPRATVRWGDDGDAWGSGLDLPTIPTGSDVVGAVVAVHRALLHRRSGDRASLDHIRPADPPLVEQTQRPPWRGVGPYGHGGSGMTGGTPYGRPLPDRADDLRDGLKLDALSVVVGPFFPAFPVGLTLDVILQGDLVQDAVVRDNPFVIPAPVGSAIDVFEEAATTPMPIATLELARAAHHLRAMARMLRLLGLDGLSIRTLRVATAPPDRLPDAARRLLRLLRRIAVGRSLPPSGVVDGVAAQGRGFLARAAGRPVDARIEDPAYVDLGFAPVCAEGGGARARWHQRLAEVDQTLELAAAAGDRVRDPGPAVEHPAPVTAAVLPQVPDLLVGLEWGDAVTVITSLDLDLRQPVAAAAPASAA